MSSWGQSSKECCRCQLAILLVCYFVIEGGIETYGCLHVNSRGHTGGLACLVDPVELEVHCLGLEGFVDHSDGELGLAGLAEAVD